MSEVPLWHDFAPRDLLESSLHANGTRVLMARGGFAGDEGDKEPTRGATFSCETVFLSLTHGRWSGRFRPCLAISGRGRERQAASMNQCQHAVWLLRAAIDKRIAFSRSSLYHTADNAHLCGSRGGRPGLPVLNKPYGFCERLATLKVQ